MNSLDKSTEQVVSESTGALEETTTAGAEEDRSSLQWHASDAAYLQPDTLRIGRVKHGWERQPSKPYLKQHVRVGKVWKRDNVLRRIPIAPQSLPAHHSAESRLKLRGSRQSSPLKPVKKVCIESSFGPSARVSQWEGNGTPTRKIVTRSTSFAQEMLALPDDGERPESSKKEEEDATFEIVNQDGSIVAVTQSDVLSKDWMEDESEKHNSSDGEWSTESDSIHDAVVEHIEAAGGQTESAENSTQPTEISSIGSFIPQGSAELHSNLEKPQYDHNSLPEGFVSPAKRPTHNASRLRSLQSRRRTLPMSFAPPVTTIDTSADATDGPEITTTDNSANSSDHLDDEELGHRVDAQEPAVDYASDEDWENIEEDDVSTDRPDDMGPKGETTSAEELMGTTLPSVVFQQESQTDSDAQVLVQPSPVGKSPSPADVELSQHTIGRPVVESSHASLALRMSPRRKSTSPMKIRPATRTGNGSHLIAFSPLKPSESSSDPISQATAEALVEFPDLKAYANSAKESEPGLSDEFAVLAAFLMKAAKNRRDSDLLRQSVRNPRDPDDWRLARGDEPRTDVLSEMDPNSPSLRKPSLAEEVDDCASRGSPVSDNVDSRELADIAVSRPRRSGRVSRAPVRDGTSISAPSKVSIRRSSEINDSKVSESYMRGYYTRRNTRLNKEDAVPPLVKLACFKIAEIAEQYTEGGEALNVEPCEDNAREAAPRPLSGKYVTWAERLVEYYQDPRIDSSASGAQLSYGNSKSAASSNVVEQQDLENGGGSTKPKRTRSKRAKIRTPAKVAHLSESAEEAMEDSISDDIQPVVEESAKKRPPPARRSRIATPAKGLGRSPSPTLDPETTDERTGPPSTARALPPPAFKLASAIPAPFTQGKENLIASPPKKNRSLSFARTSAPKFEIPNSKAKLDAPTFTSSISGAKSAGATPGLVSPAKKPGRNFNSTNNVPEVVGGRLDSLPNLSSPAKKRTRRN